MSNLDLSFNSRKALCIHLGEAAGTEVAHLLQQVAARVERLERTKVEVTPVAPFDATPGTSNTLQEPTA